MPSRRRPPWIERVPPEPQLRKLAARLAQLELGPQVRAARQQALLGGKAITGASDALGRGLSAVAGQTDDAYLEAGRALAALGGGFSGAPLPAGSGDVVYGQAALPAGALISEGARARAAAQAMAGVASRRGMQDVSSLQAQAQQKIGDIEAQRAGLVAKNYQDLISMAIQRRGLGLNAGALGLDRAELRENRRQFDLSLAQRERESAREAWLAHQEQLGEKGDASDEKWEAAQDAWFGSRKDAAKLADELYNRTKKGGGYRDEEVPNRPKYGRAFAILWNQVGTELFRRYGFPRRKVNQMLHAMLKQAGFKRNRRKGGALGAGVGAAAGTGL